VQEVRLCHICNLWVGFGRVEHERDISGSDGNRERDIVQFCLEQACYTIRDYHAVSCRLDGLHRTVHEEEAEAPVQMA